MRLQGADQGRGPQGPRLFGFLLPALVALALPAAAAVQIDSNTFGALEARALGPASMSGRIAALDATSTRPMKIFVGSASGGVWRSTDGGTSFEPVFDEHTQSIGAVRITPDDHDVIWVGTGESWTRNSVSVGNGVFRSTDGGESWSHVGLEDSERIAAIAVPAGTEGKTAFVCATGHLWDSNEQRGVYKTTDGGESWEQVLSVDENTGCSDLAIDPQDPQVLYAGMWQFRRYPDFFESGGPGSGLYRSLDGGDSWTELTAGLPQGEKGRIAVAVAPSRPSTVYAIVEAETTALYRSDDLGGQWREMNSSFNVKARPFYFARIVVDPTDHQVVYKPALTLAASLDGGKSFNSLFAGGFAIQIHPDHHAVWIDPQDPHTVLLGTDGGLYLSRDRARTWRFQRNLPISQFYHVSYDMEEPYNVYGGLQDNGTWMGPSRAAGGVRNKHWQTIGFGDGFWAFTDRSDPDYAYVEYQGGMLSRYRKSTQELKEIRPLEGEADPKFRFNWNTPIYPSRADAATVYYGSQFLHRTRDRGESWQRLSGDLTTNDPQRQRQEQSGGLSIDNSTAENNATIYSISDEPANGDVIWVGTDDGRLQVTRDGGSSWTDVFGNVPDLPEGTWVSTVEASRHKPGRAYATFDGHRTGDMATYAYRTDDYGKSWRSIAGDSIEGYAFVVREDLLNPDLLFVGTEFGLYVSLDAGQQWARFKSNLPRVAVHDIAIHPREHDLIVGTHGRGIYIIDDITPIRALTQQALESDVALLPSRPAMIRSGGLSDSFGGNDEFIAANREDAVDIVYYLKKRHIFGDLKVEIYDPEGNKLIDLPGGKRKGINRVRWPMRRKPPQIPSANSLIPAFTGPRVPEGTYRVKLIKGKQTYDTTVEIVGDPASGHTSQDRAVAQEATMQTFDLLERLSYVVAALGDVAEQASERRDAAGEQSRLGKQIGDWIDAGEALRKDLVATSDAGWLSGQERLRERLGSLYGALVGYDGRPTRTQLDRVTLLGRQLVAAEGRFDQHAGGIEALNAQLGRKKLEPLTLMSREDWQAQRDEGSSSSSSSSTGSSGISPTAAKAAFKLGRRLGWLFPHF